MRQKRAGTVSADGPGCEVCKLQPKLRRAVMLTDAEVTRGPASIWAPSKGAPLPEALSDGMTSSRRSKIEGVAECANFTRARFYHRPC